MPFPFLYRPKDEIQNLRKQTVWLTRDAKNAKHLQLDSLGDAMEV